MARGSRPFVSLLTDFGLRDPSAAICKGVILGVCPQAQVIDISHEVGKFAIRDGALLLWCALPYLPVGVHVAVVDPGVGTGRRPIAVRVGRGDVLIGPDNGLLVPVLERLGGPVEARAVENRAYRLEPVSTSFHGRDIFSPAAGHVAAGAELESLGPPVDLDSLVALSFPEPRVEPGRLETQVIYVDTFGNLKLGAMGEELHAAFGPLANGTPLRVSAEGRAIELAWGSTFGDVSPGIPLLYEDSYGRLCLAVNQGSAAKQLRLAEDTRIRLEPISS